MKYISDLHFINTPSSLHINIRLADPLSPLLSELSPYLEKGKDSYYFFDRYVLKDWYAIYKYLICISICINIWLYPQKTHK